MGVAGDQGPRGHGLPGPKGVPGEKGSQFYSQEEVRTMVLSTLKVYVDTNPTERTNLEDREYWREGRRLAVKEWEC